MVRSSRLHRYSAIRKLHLRTQHVQRFRRRSVARFTGSDNLGTSFTALPGSSTVESGVTPAQFVTLSWATFTEAADQAGISRRYGGIHFKADDLVGRQT